MVARAELAVSIGMRSEAIDPSICSRFGQLLAAYRHNQQLIAVCDVEIRATPGRF
jgi:hypothetical protein